MVAFVDCCVIVSESTGASIACVLRPRSVFAGIGFAVVAAFLDQVTQGIFEGVSEGFAQVVQGSPESASQ